MKYMVIDFGAENQVAVCDITVGNKTYKSDPLLSSSMWQGVLSPAHQHHGLS